MLSSLSVTCKVLCGLVLPSLLLLASSQPVRAQLAPLPEDKYIWLEDAHGERATNWVKAENARTAKVFDADPRMAAFEADALKLAEAPDRLPYPTFAGDKILNFWQDAEHVRGIDRQTTLEDFLSAKPNWQTIIDYDALGKQENVSWVNHGMNCMYPNDSRCLVTLSVGGEDADSMREFDLKTAKFVSNGFALPHSKQMVSWKDRDTLLVARDWGAGTMTKSGYPYIVKEWKRGTPLDQAKEVFRGQESDMLASGFTMRDAQGDVMTVFLRQVTFFEGQYQVETPKGLKTLSIPKKSSPAGLLDGRFLLTISEDWTPAGQSKTFRQGSLLEMKLKEVIADPEHLKPSVIFEPTAQEFLGQSATTKSRLLVTTLDHVQGKAYVYTPSGSGWTRKPLPVPENVTVTFVAANATDEKFFLDIEGFLSPSALWMGDAGTASLVLEKTEPARFDASKDVVEQLEATSKDGTKVPYFLVHAKGMKYDGSQPTLMTAYGGFEASSTPYYDANLGKLWLEHGGAFVLANIRGGGEFGPAWHEAGLKTHRQRIYDDFAAVGEDLIARKITSPRRLGIQGGSNGGLLMGVEMTERPDLWNAIAIEVPLLDMLRFEQIAAGASWVGEYGSMTVPEERAFWLKTSPYTALKPDGKYPVPFIFTTTKDDRVGPQHARKFAAKMEEFGLPFYYDEILEGGHGSGADLKQQARTSAETYLYFTRKLMD